MALSIQMSVYYIHLMTTQEEGYIEMTQTEQEKDPLLLQEITLTEDYYALCWLALKKDIWDNKELRTVKIFPTTWDLFWLKTNFCLFLTLIMITFFLILYEVFTNEIEVRCSIYITVLRIIIAGLSQKLLAPEIYQGLAKVRYTLDNPNDFGHYFFALFIALSQVFVAWGTIILIFLIVCTESTALDLLMNFTGIAVLSEFDDWLGAQIVSETPHKSHEGDDNSLYEINPDTLNDDMKLSDKLALLYNDDDMAIIDDQNVPSSCLRRIFAWFYQFNTLWFFLPLVIILIEYMLLKYDKNAI